MTPARYMLVMPKAERDAISCERRRLLYAGPVEVEVAAPCFDAGFLEVRCPQDCNRQAPVPRGSLFTVDRIPQEWLRLSRLMRMRSDPFCWFYERPAHEMAVRFAMGLLLDTNDRAMRYINGWLVTRWSRSEYEVETVGSGTVMGLRETAEALVSASNKIL